MADSVGLKVGLALTLGAALTLMLGAVLGLELMIESGQIGSQMLGQFSR